MTEQEIRNWLRRRNEDEPNLRSHDYIKACCNETDAYGSPEEFQRLRYAKIAVDFGHMRREDTESINDKIVAVPEQDDEGQEYFTFCPIAQITKERHERSITARFFKARRKCGRLLSEIRFVESAPRNWQLILPFDRSALEHMVETEQLV